MNFGVRPVQDQLQITGPVKASVLEATVNPRCLHYTELFDYLLVGFEDGGIRAIQNQQSKMEFIDNDVKNSPVTMMKHRPISKNFPMINTLVCTYENGFVKFWNYNFKQCVHTLNEKRNVTNIIYHPKLAKFVTMGDNKKMYIYDEDSKRQERVLSASDDIGSTDGHQGVIMTAVFHPRNQHELISGGLDGTIQFWDTRKPHSVRSIVGINLVGDGLDFVPSGNEFITCTDCKDGSLKLWNYADGKLVKVLEPDKKNIPLSCGRFIDKSHFVCGGGEPNLVRILAESSYQTTASIGNIPKLMPNFALGPADSGAFPKFAFCAGKKIFEISPT